MARVDNMQADALDGAGSLAKGRMTRTPYIAALAAAALLAGCNEENHTIVAGGGPADERRQRRRERDHRTAADHLVDQDLPLRRQ